MHIVEYKAIDVQYLEKILQIYASNNWTNYLHDHTKLRRALSNSLFVLGAFVDGALVGFIRLVGDAEYIVYVQDLIIKPDLKRQGIGKTLMHKAFEKFKNVRQFVLITDKEDQIANAFYQSLGMTSDLDGYPINHYFHSVKY